MCFGGGDDTASKLAAQQAQAEQDRQTRINQGMQQIQAMFEGGNLPSGQVASGASYDPNATYYTSTGDKWTPTDPTAYLQALQKSDPMAYAAYGIPDQPAAVDPNFSPSQAGAGVDAQLDARQGYNANVQANTNYQQATQAAQQKALQDQFAKAVGGGLYSSVTPTTGYNSDFYDKAYNAQLAYAMPQVDKQYADAQRTLEYALARQGLGSSTQANTVRSDLEGQKDLAVQQQQDTANTVRNQQMSAVEQERSNLTNMLQQTGDVGSTMNAAQAGKAIIDAAPAMQTVGPLFQNVTGTLADMIVSPAIRQQTANAITSGFGNSNSSGRVVN